MLYCTSRLNPFYLFFFFLNDTATTKIYPLPLHAPLPIYPGPAAPYRPANRCARPSRPLRLRPEGDRRRNRIESEGQERRKIPSGLDLTKHDSVRWLPPQSHTPNTCP